MASCLTPFSVKNKLTNETIPVPCGKCPACVARRTSGWSFRLMQQQKIARSSLFVTLTYDTTFVPITRRGFMVLCKVDVQKFFKRLRKKHYELDKTDHKRWPISYYAVGEYGGRTFRPHYHVLLFNAKPELIASAWTLGSIHMGTLTPASVGYTMKYISKPSKIPLHANDDRIPEFSLMSKGIGANYLTDSMRSWHHSDMDNRMYCNLTDGKKISMPRYYKDKVYTELERKRIGYFARQKMLKEQLEAEQDPDYWRNKSEADLAQFKKMYSRALERNKI